MAISPIAADRNSYLSPKYSRDAEEKRIAAQKIEKKRIEKKEAEAIQTEKVRNMQDAQTTSVWDYYPNPEFIAYKIRQAVKT